MQSCSGASEGLMRQSDRYSFCRRRQVLRLLSCRTKGELDWTSRDVREGRVVDRPWRDMGMGRWGGVCVEGGLAIDRP